MLIVTTDSSRICVCTYYMYKYSFRSALFIRFYFTHLISILGVSPTQNSCSAACHFLANTLHLIYRSTYSPVLPDVQIFRVGTDLHTDFGRKNMDFSYSLRKFWTLYANHFYRGMTTFEANGVCDDKTDIPNSVLYWMKVGVTRF